MRNNVKLLFADLYRYEAGIRANVKDAGKLTDALLIQGDWDGLSKAVNAIWDEVSLIEKQAGQMRILLEKFISAGDYPGQTIQMTPMESMAQEK